MGACTIVHNLTRFSNRECRPALPCKGEKQMKNSWKLWIALSFLAVLAVPCYSQTPSGSSRAEKRDLPVLIQKKSSFRASAASQRAFTERGAYIPAAVFSASMKAHPDAAQVVSVQAAAAVDGDDSSTSWLQWAKDDRHSG